jgi:hypothetical protein
MTGAEDMKYILLMAGTKAGVDTYRAWSQSDVQAHFAFLKGLNRELSESGELVANEPLAGPDQAKVVRAGMNGAPITDGVFPEVNAWNASHRMVEFCSYCRWQKG